MGYNKVEIVLNVILNKVLRNLKYFDASNCVNRISLFVDLARLPKKLRNIPSNK